MKSSRLSRVAEEAPLVTTKIPSARHIVGTMRARGLKVGLVPTMGCFHEGHLSLLRAARMECDYVAVSIFVNPIQFAAGEDLDAYPRDLDRDLKMAADETVDLVFVPEASEMYGRSVDVANDDDVDGQAFDTYIEPGSAAEGLCGSARPDHFRGVATIVAKLFNIFQPDSAFFGRKDAQQVAVIRQLARDLDYGVEIRVLPTVREPDGLAMSSRNTYLSEEEREHAAVLFEALSRARFAAGNGERSALALRSLIAEAIDAEPGVELEYAEVVDADTMHRVKDIGKNTLAAVAASIGGTRLIDNSFMFGGVDH